MKWFKFLFLAILFLAAVSGDPACYPPGDFHRRERRLLPAFPAEEDTSTESKDNRTVGKRDSLPSWSQFGNTLSGMVKSGSGEEIGRG
jgi:hypothetical protein